MKGILTKKLRRSKIKVHSNQSYNVLDHSIHKTIFCCFKSYKKTVLVILGDFVSDLVLHRAYTKCKHVGHLTTPWESSEVHEKRNASR